MQTRSLAALIGMITLCSTSGIATVFAQEPIPQDQVSPYCFCICIVEEILALPTGYSLYLGERHLSACGADLDCGNGFPLFLALESGIPADDCETTGCFYGNNGFAKSRLNKPLPAAIAKKVPHDFKPKFSPTYSGNIEIIHSDFISFVHEGQKRRAKTFLVKIQPSEVTEKNPVRVVGLGFEVEHNAKTTPVLTVTRKKSVEELCHSTYHVNIRGMTYGIVTTEERPDSAASVVSGSPTLAVKE